MIAGSEFAQAWLQVLVSSGLLGTRAQLQQGRADVAAARRRARAALKAGGIVKERLLHAMLAAEVRSFVQSVRDVGRNARTLLGCRCACSAARQLRRALIDAACLAPTLQAQMGCLQAARPQWDICGCRRTVLHR